MLGTPPVRRAAARFRQTLRPSFVALVALGVLLTFGAASRLVASPASDARHTLRPPLDREPLAPVTTGGLESLDRALARLAVHRRVLVVAAHPDDEDSSLLAREARGLGGEAAYLSLTRGEGGQNLIGDEAGVALGLLRSSELASARRIDGARQYFTRAYDFGYTRSIEETFERWPRAVLEEDVARVIRRFKPQVVVTIFPPDERAGHGQHQASAIVADAVYRQARSDEDHHPALTAETLGPWRPQALYRAAWWDRDAATVTTDLGLLEPFSGRSVLQIALASRSQHRCQDMGQLQPAGESTGAYVRVDPPLDATEGAEGDLFDDVDTRLRAMADGLRDVPADASLREQVLAELDAVEALALEARRSLAPRAPERIVPLVAEIVERLSRVEGLVAPPGEVQSARRTHLAALVGEKLQIAHEALATAAGVMADAWTDRARVVPGETIEVQTVVWRAGARPADPGMDPAPFDRSVLGPWSVESDSEAEPNRSRFATTVDSARTLRLRLDPATAPSTPYFLEGSLGDPLDGDLYRWEPDARRGEPFGPPPLRIAFTLSVDGTPIELVREVVARQRDQARGEVREPLRVVPPLEVSLDRDAIVWPLAAPGTSARRSTRLLIDVTSHLDRPVAARLHVTPPSREDTVWDKLPPYDFTLDEAYGRVQIPFVLSPRPPAADGSGLRAGVGTFDVAVELVDEPEAESEADERFARAFPVVDYPHIRPVARPVPASLAFRALDIALPPLRRIGWIRGASDTLPERLAEVGLPIEEIHPATLAAADAATLDGYDAIVVGSRAFEVVPELAAANARLLDAARRGGLLLMLYQQYPWTTGGYPPLPLDIARPHDRVTDETAPVRLLEPEHPAFTRPNRLDAADWRGWVQERGLYFAHTWDDGYTPLLEFDAVGVGEDGDEPLRGGLLVAPLGEGTFVYTGLAFHRQIPAGVPGAYRLFANLLALAADTASTDTASTTPEPAR